MTRSSLWVGVALLGLVAAGAARTNAADDLADLPKRLAAAPKLETEDLCEPVRSIREGMLLWAPNADSKTWDILQIYFPKYGGPNTIAIVDLATGEVKMVQTDRGWNFHLCPSVIAPNGKLFISALDGRMRQKICLYDPASNELTLDAVKMPDELLGETHPLVLGTNGKIYAIGQHPDKTAAAAEIDPDSLEATFYGSIGPSHAPNACWGYSGAADDRYIYIASGKVPWYLVAFDRQTRKWESLATTEPVGGYVSVSQRADGCTATASGLTGQGDRRFEYWLHEGKAIAIEAANKTTPPWPTRETARKLPPQPEVNTARAVPDAEGFAELWVRPAQSAEAWRKFRYQTPLFGHEIYRLFELPDGRIFGTAGAYEGNLMFYPKTGKGEHLGKTHLSHYASAILDGKLYMSGYPSSPLYVYDPGKPWTAGKLQGDRPIEDTAPDANPRQLLLMGDKSLAGTHKMFSGATGADGKVYFGGAWMRDGSCGGLAWYDPTTKQAGGFWKPLSNYQVTHLAAADGGNTIVVSTRRIEDTLLGKPKPEQGALFFLDTKSGQLSAPFAPVAQAKGSGTIVAKGRRVVGWTEDPANEKGSTLYGVDLDGPKLAFVHQLPVPLPAAVGSNQQEKWDFRLGPDGLIWTFSGNTLVRIDPADGRIEPVGTLSSAGRLAFADGKVFLGGTTAVRRIVDLP
jgi:hypothetical protein